MIDATRSFPFTASQWQELEQQTLVFRYFVSGVPVPPDLISTVITTPAAFNSLYSSSSSSSSRLFPLQQPSLPIGWGCFQMGYGRKVDPEPGRCRRTDGKKWRCSKEAFPDSKYCERHMHRGKSKAKKLLQFQPFNTTTTTTIAAATTNTDIKVAPPQQPPAPPPTMRACGSSLYPFLSPNSPSSSNSSKQQPCDSTMSIQNHATPLWLLDPELYYDQPNKNIRYLHEMKGGGVGERMIGSGTSRIKMNTSSNSSGCSSEFAFREHKREESLNVDVKEDDEAKKKAFHHFLGDYDHIRGDSGSRPYKLSTPISSQTPYYRL